MRRRWLRAIKARGKPWRPTGSRERASSGGSAARTSGSKRSGSPSACGDPGIGREGGCEQVLEQEVAILAQKLCLAGQHPARKVGGETAGKQTRRLLGDPLASGKLGGRAQGFG